jgi:hypothetical protein
MDCHDKLNAKVAEATDKLEAEGKRVVGGTTLPLTSEERIVSGQTQYRFSGKHELQWVSG